MKDKPALQSLTAKKAETKRPFHGMRAFQDGASADVRRRADFALADFETLKDRISFSPFIEIGAGGGQRSAVLVNKFEADGVATDISQNSLKNAPYNFVLLGCRRDPMLICCDAHHLPFLPDTFKFAFAYRTLHHFENPIPVVAECYRVLGRGGYFFFNEEPMDTPLRRILRGKRTLSHPPTRWQRIAYRLGIERIFWDDGARERAMGITEARFDIGLWRKALEPFSRVEAVINRKVKIHSDLHKPVLKAFLSGIIGGNVRGLCQKAGGEPIRYMGTNESNTHPSDYFRERLVCLDCGSNQLSETPEGHLRCTNCNRTYPKTKSIIRMLPQELEEHLYGETSDQVQDAI